MSYKGAQAWSWVLSIIHLVGGSVEVLHLDSSRQTRFFEQRWRLRTHWGGRRRALFARPRLYCKKLPFACGWWVRISKVSRARIIVSESVRQTKKNTRCMGVFRQSLYRSFLASGCFGRYAARRCSTSRLTSPGCPGFDCLFHEPIPTYLQLSENNWYKLKTSPLHPLHNNLCLSTNMAHQESSLDRTVVIASASLFGSTRRTACPCFVCELQHSQTRARPLIEVANKISKKAQVRIDRIVSGKNHQTKTLHKTTSLACTYAEVFTSNAECWTLSRIQLASNFVCATGSSKMNFAFESPGYQAHEVYERSSVSENESCPFQKAMPNHSTCTGLQSFTTSLALHAP